MSKTKKIIFTIALFILALLIVFVAYAFLNPHPHSTSTYRNGLRLRSVRTLASGLELYFDDNKRYPEKLSQLPIGYSERINFPIVKVSRPACPLTEPLAYKASLDGKYYAVTFCLPESDTQYAAGYHILTPSGIK